MSSDDDDFDDIDLFPITDLLSMGCDRDSGAEASDEREDSESDVEKNEEIIPPPMSLRQRRLSKSLAGVNALKLSMDQKNKNDNFNNELNRNRTKKKFFSFLENEELDNGINLSPGKDRARHNWLLALKKAKTLKDPWAEFHIEDIKTEKCIRHRYHPHKRTWVKDEVAIKMETKPFNRGAMRQCYRLKKCSSFVHTQDWHSAGNYVAKHYIEKVDRDVYFQDVKLQMDAKVWGEEYNRHNPPKKVDIFQMYILEFIDRDGSPLYHLEHYIEGEYIKYNSNSGFVEETLRYTPQAISHFTFERSGHKLIVVDIQGVGDLYTDPQIHTIDGNEYGDGNLGAKGMALFFHSHICNDICHSLDLTEFDLSNNEITMHKDFLRKQKKSAMKTRVRGHEEHCLSLSSPDCKVDITRFLERQRSNSSALSDSIAESPCTTGVEDEDTDDHMSIDSPLPIPQRSRTRFISESASDSQSSMTAEEEREAFQRMAQQRARPSCVALEIDLRKMMNHKIGDSILGKVHHEMAKYHEIGRFIVGDPNEDDVDWESAIYHEEHAADLGEMEAILTMARLYLGLSRNVLVNCIVQNCSDTIDIGNDYMIQAAEAGDRSAMIHMAEAYELGNNLGVKRSKSWEDAVYWYEQAMNTENHDEGGEYDSTMDMPMYQLMAKQAEMYLEGGFGLDKDPQRAGDLYNDAAESATEAMKGRLASKYFMLAEEAWGQVEE